MATGDSRPTRCILCALEYRRSDSLRRHYLSAHQLLWQHDQLTGVTDTEFEERIEALRRRQMSSRRRRRLRASLSTHRRGEDGCSSCDSRVAAVRSAATSAESWDDDCPPLLQQFTLPDLPELAYVPEASLDDGSIPRDGAAWAGPAPPVVYDQEVQTEPVPQHSESTMAVPPAVHWPAGVDYRAGVRLVRSRPDLSIESLLTEAMHQFPVLEADRDIFKFALLGIAWGLECQARFVLDAVSQVMSEPESGHSTCAALQADLCEQAARHY